MELMFEEICQCAKQGDTEAVQQWFSTGTRDVDQRAALWHGNTLLRLAACSGHCDLMRVLLVDHDAGVDVANVYRSTPLQGAAYGGWDDAAVLLLDRGAQIHLADDGGATPLIAAAYSGSCTMIRLLLSRGANFATRDEDGRTAEDIARNHSEHEATALLADVRLAGDWRSYLRFPRKRLLALRVLCERGRASTDDALLRRLFPWQPPVQEKQGPTTRAARAQAGQLPKEVFWLILKFWRSDRDSRS